MKETTKFERFVESIKSFISGIFWKGFLKVNGFTEETYAEDKWVDEVLWRLHKGKYDHSVYLHCRACNSWGIPLIASNDRKECGNCSNKTDTTVYFPIDFL